MRKRRPTGTRRNLGTGPSNKLKLIDRQGRAGEDGLLKALSFEKARTKGKGVHL